VDELFLLFLWNGERLGVDECALIKNRSHREVNASIALNDHAKKAAHPATHEDKK
jgi:hypothetical protein